MHKSPQVWKDRRTVFGNEETLIKVDIGTIKSFASFRHRAWSRLADAVHTNAIGKDSQRSRNGLGGT
jgi:hypothetical protein